MTTLLEVELPEDLIRQLDLLVPTPHRSRSDAVRRALELYLYSLASERDLDRYEQLPLTDAELSFADSPDA